MYLHLKLHSLDKSYLSFSLPNTYLTHGALFILICLLDLSCFKCLSVFFLIAAPPAVRLFHGVNGEGRERRKSKETGSMTIEMSVSGGCHTKEEEDI